MELTQEVPMQLKSLDPHAAKRWPVFLRKAGLKMTRNGWNDPHRARIVVNFGIPSLLRRLAHATTEVERARIWWRESAACAAGESISDLSDENRYVLNPFIDEGPKFKNARIEAMKAAKKAAPVLRMPILVPAASDSDPERAARKLYYLRCVVCGKRFRAARLKAKTCSDACRSKLCYRAKQAEKAEQAELAVA